MMEDYRESHIPMLGMSLMMNEHYTIHQKEFRRSTKGPRSSSEHGSTSLRREERMMPDLGMSLMQGKHEHFRKPKAHGLNWRTKKLTSAAKKEERAEEASEHIPGLSISLPQRFHETIREHHFKTASPSKEEKKKESTG